MFLAARDELALTWLAEDATAADLAHTAFREPDLDDALTAVALEPAAHRLVRKLPLALHRDSIVTATEVPSREACAAAPVLTTNTGETP